MKLLFPIITLMVLLTASCGGSSKGPGSLIGPPSGPPPTGPQTPTVPGIGTSGKLSINVEEGGSVLTNPDVGTCSGRAVCDFSVNRGTIVTLRAFANPGWVFEEWEQCPGPSGTLCVVTIDALTYVKAEFDRAP